MSARKIASPHSDWRVTSAPQLGPMNDELTSLIGTSYASASAAADLAGSRIGRHLVGLDARRRSSPTVVDLRVGVRDDASARRRCRDRLVGVG